MWPSSSIFHGHPQSQHLCKLIVVRATWAASSPGMQQPQPLRQSASASPAPAWSLHRLCELRGARAAVQLCVSSLGSRGGSISSVRLICFDRQRRRACHLHRVICRASGSTTWRRQRDQNQNQIPAEPESESEPEPAAQKSESRVSDCRLWGPAGAINLRVLIARTRLVLVATT